MRGSIGVNAMKKPNIRHRERLWEPEWNNEIIGWTRKFVIQNRWRTETYNDIDDLMQDAHIVFLKVRDKYPQVTEAAHFMSMYKTSLWRHFMDRGRKLKNDILIERYLSQQFLAYDKTLGYSETRLQEMLRDTEISRLENAFGQVDYNEGAMIAMIMSGPPEVQMLMMFLSKDENLALLREPQRKRRDATPRKTIDQRLSSLLGIPDFPFRDTIRQWLFT